MIASLIVTAMLLIGMKYPAPLYSPGEIAKKHEKVRCKDCHAPFKRIPSESCVASDCHSGTLGKKTAIRDLHEKAKGGDCLTCHTDHKGIDAKITIDFDHKALPEKAGCSDCHKSEGEKAHKEKYGETCCGCHTTKSWKAVTFSHGKVANTKCIDCHRAAGDKAHKDRYVDNCKSCHNTKKWKEVTFNHDSFTGRPCSDCHKGPKDELHTSIGKDCKSCHTTNKWKPSTYDHTKYFPLDKDHKVGCKKCHDQSDYKTYNCMNCHIHATRGIIKEHREERIKNFGDCLGCHRVHMNGKTYGQDRTGENESMIDDDDHKYRNSDRKRRDDDDDEEHEHKKKSLFKSWLRTLTVNKKKPAV